MKKLGFIGYGEAAHNITVGLKEEGFGDIIAYDKYWDTKPNSELITGRAAKTGVKLYPSLQELVENSEMVVCAVSADKAVRLSKQASPFLKSNQIYVDINATSPMTKEEVGAIISPVASFVDCAVMGPVPPYKHKVPVTVSGSGAKAFLELMEPFGMKITYMDAPAGSASAIKMMRSIFMKGYVMLILEMLLAARKYQVAEEVVRSVGVTIASGDFLEKINGLVGRGVIHSERREHEMDEVIATLSAIDVNGIMSQATKAKLNWCTKLGLKEHFKGVPPEDFNQIFAALDEMQSGKA
jgi:3-hydroxyisobutyrate dehydrogenase-like beta-hydroxyacid dehydrogenase